MRAKSNYIDPVQMQRIYDAIPSLSLRKWKPEDVKMLFKLAYWCGLRMGEAVRLKAEDFNLLYREVYLGKTKTNSEDWAAIPDVFITDLEEYLKDKKGELFPDCNTQIVRVWLTKLGKMLDIPALTTPQSITREKTKGHIFRKSIGKDMLYGVHDSKAPLNVVMKHLRHKKLDTTTQYLKVGVEDVKDWWRHEPLQSESSSWETKPKVK